MFCTLAALVGCSGGGDSSSSSNVNTNTSTNINTPATISMTGVVVDGYLQGATAFLDLNRNGVLDAGEPSALTDANGNYSLSVTAAQAASGASVVVEVPATAVDKDTGLAVGTRFVMSAPANQHAVISPMTTMVKEQQDANAGLSTADAEENVKRKFGIGGSTISLLTDYVSFSQDAANPNQAAYARLHNIARVSAQAVKNNLAGIEAAAAGTGATLEDILGLIVDKILAELPNIALQVDSVPTTNFDPVNALAGTGVNVILTGTVAADISNVQTANLKPVITLLGANQVTVVQNNAYVDAGATANSNVDGDLTSKIVKTGIVDTATVGTYVLQYDVKDAANRLAAPVLRVVNVAAAPDNTAPVLTLNGPAAVNIDSGVLYVDPGAASDDPYAAIVVAGYVNSAKPGTYTITYNSTDSSGNAAIEISRVVTVLDVTPPAVFVLNGDVNMSLLVGSTYTEQGVAAWDALDGDISANVVITGGPVNTGLVGSYVLTYNIQDAAGNAASPLTRTVNVVADSTPPVVTAPANITMEATAALNMPALGSATVTDNVDVGLVAAPSPTGPYTVGVHTITWTATDAAGNVGTASQTLTIIDSTAPTITAPANITMEALGATTAVSLGVPTAVSDLTGTPTVTNNAPANFLVGSSNVVWLASDGFGNSTSVTQVVTITDTTPPTITVAGGNAVNASLDGVYTDAGATATDIVNGVVSVATSGTVNTAVAGNYTITYTATDAAGNVATATRTVTVAVSTPVDPMITQLSGNGSLYFYGTGVDTMDPTGVYRRFSSGAVTLNPDDTINLLDSVWNPVTAAFEAPAVAATTFDHYSILLTSTGWQLVPDSNITFVDDGNGSVLLTHAPGVDETWSSTVFDVANQNIQTAISTNIQGGVGAGRWATAVAADAIFSAGAKLYNNTILTNQNQYVIDQWDDGTGCLTTNGNCNVAAFWDHVADFNGQPGDVKPTQLSQILSITGDTLPFEPTLQLYKELHFLQDYSVALMAASSASTTGEARIYFMDGAYNFFFQPITERVPDATATWSLVNVNGQPLIEFTIPVGFVLPDWMQGVSKIIFSVQNGFVRQGMMTPAGSPSTNGPGWFANAVADQDIKANFSRLTNIYDPVVGGGVTYVWDPYTYETIAASNGAADIDTEYVYDSISGVWSPSSVVTGLWVLDTTGNNSGFRWLKFTADGINTYNPDGTITFSMGSIGFGLDVKIGATVDDVRGEPIANYVDPSVAVALINPNATFSNPGPGNSAPTYITRNYRMVGDGYIIPDQAPMPGLSALAQLIGGTYPNIINGFEVSINGLATDTSGTATWTNGPLFFNSNWDIRVVHGVQMLYVNTPPDIMPMYQTNQAGIFAALIGGQVYGIGNHLVDGVGAVLRYNMDSVVSGGSGFNAAAIADIKGALGRP